MSRPLYSATRKRVINVPNIQIKPVPTYVSVYFDANEHQQPRAPIDIYDWDLDTSRDEVAAKFEAGDLDPKSASTYLYQLAGTMNCKLEEDWISYGVQIGAQGDNVNPLTLIHPVLNISEGDAKDGIRKRDKEDDNWLSIAVCGHYRISLAPDAGNYVADISRKIQDLMITMGYQGASTIRRSVAFSTSRTFKALIAVFDMFWNKIPNPPLGEAQVGTLVSRYQDCTILGSMGSVSKSVGLDSFSLLQWIFNKEAGEEALMIAESPDELAQFDSYLPYLHGLLLTSKSPYSAASCPNLHYWIHFVGCTVNLRRSVDARIVEGANQSEIPVAAVLVGYALKETTDLNIVFFKDKEEFEVANANPEQEYMEGEADEPNTRSPTAWLAWFKGLGGQLTPAMRLYVQAAKARIDAVRAHTVGEAFSREVY